MKTTALIAVFLAGSAAAAPAAAPSLLGVELGKPLSLPSCSAEFGPTKRLCEVPGPAEPGVAILSLPADGSTPAYLKGQPVITVRDGVVQAVALRTDGASGQDDAMHDLVAKFGSPTRKSARIVQNAFGDAVRGGAVSARWERAGYVVTFDGVVGEINEGAIHLLTVAEADRQGQSAPRPSL